jgi:D-alanyl-D-alanine carboxypeptidase/D-alanyl-D-alanine-endopeptidase (penicillin-binding protein 4)
MLGALIVIVAVVAGVVVSSPNLGSRLGFTAGPAASTAAPPTPVNYVPQIAPLDARAPMPTATGVATALDSLSGNPVLGSFAGTVLDADTGAVLWNQQMSMALLPASTNKVLTSAAALLILNPLSTLTTKVVAGADPGTVVLVGGGDPTLNSLTAPQQSVYPGSPRLDDLAAQVRKAHPAPITQVDVDTNGYTGPLYGPGWTQSSHDDDYTQVVPAMMDGGRLDPASTANLWDTPRTQTPAQAIGAALATRLGAAPSAVNIITTPATGQVLGEVHSAPIQDLIGNLLEISDNMLAEALGRAIAKADDKPESFAGAASAVLDILRRNGFDTTGVQLSDSSGLSPQDQVTPSLLAQVLRVATEPATTPDPRTAKLRPLLAGLPIAGATGTLSVSAGLYSAPQAAAGKGWVHAKTGTLGDQGTNTLGGYVLDRDGRILVFALMSNDSPSSGDVPAVLDTMTAALRGCGCTG